MNSTWIMLAQGCVGLAGFALVGLAPSFLVAQGFDVAGFRRSGAEEKLLWSVCLSLPLTVLLAVDGGRWFPARAVEGGWALLALAAIVVWSRQRVKVRPATRGQCRMIFAAMILLAVYLLVAVADIQIGHRLYVSTVLYDWSVRVPMVAAAMRSGVPPVNGLSALDGHPAPLRYFYFWYVVCADVARLLRLPARAGLAAGSCWALWTLLSAYFLWLKYMLRPGQELRRCCALAFLVLGTMGLDLLPTVVLLGMKKLHPYPEIEWWHQDRTPSLLSSAMYAPHHVAAFACLLTGLLVLSLTLRGKAETASAGQTAFASVFAGVCFASAAGCSILPTVIVAIVCLVWAIDLASQRHVRTLYALAGSSVVALVLARSFLRELATNAGAVSGSFASLRWRNYDFVLGYAQKYHLLTQHWLINQAMLQSGVLAINLLDLGFFLFVLIHQVRRDFGRDLTSRERAMWAFVIGTAIPYFFLSSASLASPNDLGVDAGLLLRLLLQMWAAPWVYEMWVRWRSGAGVPGLGGSWWRRAGLALAGGCLVVGLLGQAFQVVWERLYFPFVGSQVLRKQMDVLTTDRLAERLYNIREGYRGLDDVARDPAGIIQYNPIGPMQPAMTFYATHQIAAFDIGCGTGYGGDYAACQRIMPGLLELYGNTRAGFDRGRAENDRQDGAAVRTATAEDALRTCRELHLLALVAESTDSIWTRSDSWVWTMTPLTANATVRVFGCPSVQVPGS